MKIIPKRITPSLKQKQSTLDIMEMLLGAISLLIIFSIAYHFVANGIDYATKALLIYVVSVIVAIVVDYGCTKIFSKEYSKQQFKLNNILSPLVTSLLFALTLPIGTPLYVVALGSFFAIVFGKALFGGFGYNIFNPALVGRVMVQLSFGSKLVTYLGSGTDAVSSPSPLTTLASSSWLNISALPINDMLLGFYPGALGETCTVLIVLLGVLLAIKNVIDWRIPAFYLGTVAIISFGVGIVIGINPFYNVLLNLSLGGVMFGAVFMATDPVTSPVAPISKIIFAIALGFITMLIRIKGNYPEGVLFAILLLNTCTPLIDSIVLGKTNDSAIKKILIIITSVTLMTGTVSGIAYTINKNVEVEEPGGNVEEVEDISLLEYANGEYIIQVKGYGGNAKPMQIGITIADNQCTNLRFIKYNGETPEYGENLITSGIGYGLNDAALEFYNKVISTPSTLEEINSVDTVTGATYTATAIIDAIKMAFELAPTIDGDIYTYLVDAVGFYGANSPIKLKVSINISTNIITNIEVVSHTESEGYGLSLINGTEGYGLNSEKALNFYQLVFGGNLNLNELSTVDTVTGATITARGIVKALEEVATQVGGIVKPNENGAYEVNVVGFNKSSPMLVEVKVTGDQVEYVKVLEYTGETEEYGKNLIEGTEGYGINASKANAFYEAILNKSFTKDELDSVDTATGATYTAKGIVEAIEKAIQYSE